jgi:hypothetical protein
MRWRHGPTGVVAVMVSGCLVAGVVMTGCGGGSTSSSSTVTSRPRTSTTQTTAESTTTTTGPSAANDLAAYFAAASAVDESLKAAAAAANGAIGTEQITVSQATIDAINAANPSAAATKIPPGLPLDVLQRVILVQSDLYSRFYAFRGFAMSVTQPGQTEVVPVSDQRATYTLECLKNGSGPARSFATDLAAARAAAAQVPPVPVTDPSSRAAADLAVRLQYVELANSGCMNCGGARFTTLKVTWHPINVGGEYGDGDADTIPFSAHYTPGSGWTVQIDAC